MQRNNEKDIFITFFSFEFEEKHLQAERIVGIFLFNQAKDMRAN